MKVLPVLLAAAGFVGCTGHIEFDDSGPASGGRPPTTTPVTMPDGTPMSTSASLNPGRVVAHRLNNVEYDNTIRDLLGLDLKPSRTYGFPDDAYIDGFDNNADALTVPPLLLEKLETATDAIVTAALATDKSNAAVRARIMTCTPSASSEAACATEILSAFATRAYRRPVTADEVAGHAQLIGVAKGLGDGFEQGIAAGLRAILLSPRFLFRVEANPGSGKTAALDDYELASRLSYFLWSSMPDATLFAAAASGSLHESATLAAEARRLLADSRSAALMDNLAGEWLGARELAVKEVTGIAFDDALRTAVAAEPSAFLGELFHGGHAVKELLGADFMFVNARLGSHYGLSGAGALGGQLTKIAVSDSRRASGVLSQANTLTVTSMRDRTSPTRRGKWVSENLLCLVVPAPPPMIPPLDTQPTSTPMTARDRLAQHRAKGSSCAACHELIDPIGFGLEHFDAVGLWRDTDGGATIDATGVLPGTGAPFDGAASLAAVVARDPRFLDCVVKKLMTYALGRTLVTAPPAGSPLDDRVVLSDITTKLGSSDGKFDRLVELIVTSPAMTTRTGEEGGP